MDGCVGVVASWIFASISRRDGVAARKHRT